MQPFNIQILDPETYIPRKNALPITSHSIYESSSNRLHPDGFFSEVIFGQIGSRDRLVRHGYINLHTKVITPHLFKVICSLKNYYKDIMSGKTYAYFDKKEKELIRSTIDDPNADTGFSFFIKMLPLIEFRKNDSTNRNDKIDLLTKYKDLLLMDKMIVLPAGLRDIRESNGRVTTEDINKFYYSLLSLTQVLPEQETDDKIFDGIRYQIQCKVQQIYNYIIDIMDGKGGFAQSKYAARSVALSNRNVITAAPMTRITSPDDVNMFRAGEILVPLFQAMKSAVPLVVNRLSAIFMQETFDMQSTTTAIVDKHTLNLQYCEMEMSELKKFTTAEGLESLINGFRNSEVHKLPVTIKVKPGQLSNKETEGYLLLVYDDGQNIYTFKNAAEFMTMYRKADSYTLEGIDLSKLDKFDSNKFVILGSICITAYGATYYPKDYDIVVDETTFDQIKVDKNYIKQPNGVYRDEELGIDIYNEIILKDQSFADFKKRVGYTLDRYTLMSPDALLENYKISNRKKDRHKIDFLKSIVPDPNFIRPMTYVEMCYIATYDALKNKYCTATRHPVLNLEGIAPCKLHLKSTNIGRAINLCSPNKDVVHVLPEYPILNEDVKMSLSVHPSTLDKYGGDHDGDVLGLNVLLSDDANTEIQNFMNSSMSMVASNGNLIYGLSAGKIVKFCLFATSYYSLE